MAETRRTFPETGTAWPELQRDMRARKSGDVDWQHGRVPLYVFRNDQSTYEVGRDAFMEFFTENALGRARAFHSLASMEREVLDFGLDLFHAPDSGAGTFTSGGSESIFLAMKAARDEYRARTGATRADALNIVAASTLHPAFDKAAAAMDIEIRRGGLRPDMRADPAALRALIDARTMALVGSAPCFPHGVIDPIGALSELALDAGIWLHVDACVGGWMAPFFTSAGRPTPDFDFRFAGVRSISADLHKFGFCPKPASTVFYRDAADLERATFRIDDWPNGTFVTQTLVGTRPGGAVAGAWAVLNHLGRAGYEDAARRLGAMTDAYCQGIAAIPGLYMIAKPDLSIINFGARDLDIFAVSEAMARRGWLPGLTRTPKGMHAMMSLLHEPAREDYLAHLREAVAEVRAAPEARATISARY